MLDKLFKKSINYMWKTSIFYYNLNSNLNKKINAIHKLIIKLNLIKTDLTAKFINI